MSKKNDKIIVFGMIAIGIFAMAGMVAVLGIGAYVYTSDRPSPTPAPTPTPAPVSSPTPAPDLTHTFSVKKVLSDGAGRTYTLFIELEPGATAVDMSHLTVQVLADGKTYNAWDFYHGEHSSTGNGDVILNEGETFTLTLFLPQAKIPLPTGPTMQIALLVDGQTAKTINVTAV